MCKQQRHKARTERKRETQVVEIRERDISKDPRIRHIAAFAHDGFYPCSACDNVNRLYRVGWIFAGLVADIQVVSDQNQQAQQKAD